MKIVEKLQERFSEASTAFMTEVQSLKNPKKEIQLPVQFLESLKVHSVAAFLIDKKDLNLITIYSGLNQFSYSEETNSFVKDLRGDIKILVGENCLSINEQEYYTNEEVELNSKIYVVKVIPCEKRVEVFLHD